MATGKHLILDVNVIVDVWLNQGSAATTEDLFQAAAAYDARFWVTSASLATLDYVARCAFKRQGLAAEAVAEVVPQLMGWLLDRVNVLTNFGFDQQEVYRRASDFEDAQTAAAARSLAGQSVSIVTEDKTFDSLGEIARRTPVDALLWLTGHESVPHDNRENTIPFIDLATQQASLRPQIERNIERVLRHGQYILGPEVRELEARLAEYTETEHCITVASGTEALLISLMALGIQPGDEVITTPFTFVATAEVIVLLGAKPVFVDIEPDTCNIDASKIEARITPRTRAIIPVSLYGQPADMQEINDIATRHNLAVIEDAAQSFGATYRGRKSCNLSTIGCTSFFPSKPLGCYGDGGAIFTHDAALAQACREIRVHGQSKRYVHTRIGVGGRMDTLQAAIVLAKLERFDDETERRIDIGTRYNTLMDAAGIRRVLQRSDRTSVFAQYTVFVDDRQATQARLTEAGIPTAVHYPFPLNQQRAYQECCCPDCNPIADLIAKTVMSVPLGAYLRLADQERVVSSLKNNS